MLLVPEAGKPNGGQAILFANSAIFAGPGFVTLTNLSTGKSINLNISGPAQIVFTTNGAVAVNEGLTLAFGISPLAPPSIQLGIALLKGRIVNQFDSSFNLISVTFTGTAQSVCQMLE